MLEAVNPEVNLQHGLLQLNLHLLLTGRLPPDPGDALSDAVFDKELR